MNCWDGWPPAWVRLKAHPSNPLDKYSPGGNTLMKTRPALLRFAMLAAVLLSSAGPVASAGQPARVAAPQRLAAQRAAALDFEPATLVADLNPTGTAEGSGPTQY